MTERGDVDVQQVLVKHAERQTKALEAIAHFAWAWSLILVVAFILWAINS